MSTPSTAVLVTGGTGFIASYVILQLLAEGYTVRTTVRSLSREPDLRTILATGGASPEDLTRLSFFAADLQEDAGWIDAVEGVTFVHHVASPFPVDLPKHEDDLIIPAREGTLRVLKAAKGAGVKRVILTSSVAAICYGHGSHDAAFTEKEWTNLETPPTPVGAYAKSKTLAEKAAWDFISGEGAGMEFTTVNPVVVFGPVLSKSYGTSVTIIQKLLDGSVPACPALYLQSVDVRDVATLHLLAMKSPAAVGERFIAVADDRAKLLLDIGKLVKQKRPEAAKKVPTMAVPKFVVRLLSIFDASLKQILPGLGVPTNSDNTKAKNVLGWKPRTAEESILDTVDSLVKVGAV